MPASARADGALRPAPGYRSNLCCTVATAGMMAVDRGFANAGRVASHPTPPPEEVPMRAGFVGAALLTMLFTAGCDDAPAVTATRAPSSSQPSLARFTPEAWPTGEKIGVGGQSVINPIYDWTVGDAGPIIYGSRPMGPARWPAHPNVNAEMSLLVVVYPLGTTVTGLQCYDVPQENCPDHGPPIVGGAMQVMPSVYGNGVLGHDHLGAPAGKGAKGTAYAVLVLFTSNAAANTHLTTRAAVQQAVAAGQAFYVPALEFSFHNSPVNGTLYASAMPWVCPAYTTCAAPTWPQ